ncbi:MAG: methyltransferase [Wenzhouxiangellaceae bacterium]|nr:methyltransferase [Wenzhouxiangellaceae bacterium]
MFWTLLVIATLLLSLERVTYWWAWNHPEVFTAQARRRDRLLHHDPVRALGRLFVVFKFIQIGVLLGWCMVFGQTWLPLPTAPSGAIVLGLSLLALGQALNFGVIWRLKAEGMFYGNRFGRAIEWQTGFPFSIVRHPQYVGALLSVWAFLLIMRFPNPDWLALPLVSTALYAWGIHVERD